MRFARQAGLGRVAATLVALIVLGSQEVGAQASASTLSPLQLERTALSTTPIRPFAGGPAGTRADDASAPWAENAALKERGKRLEEEQRATRHLVEQQHNPAGQGDGYDRRLDGAPRRQHSAQPGVLSTLDGLVERVGIS